MSGSRASRLPSRVRAHLAAATPNLSSYRTPALTWNYAQVIKLYGEVPHAAGRYSPAQVQRSNIYCGTGKPDPRHISTSYVGRQNLTMRMSMRRFRPLTNGFSKKAENHGHSVAIHFMHYNFVRIHQSLRVTPAMAAGVTDKLWSLADMVRVIEEWETARDAKPGDRLVG